jgi:hypothetical protein
MRPTTTGPAQGGAHPMLLVRALAWWCVLATTAMALPAGKHECIVRFLVAWRIGLDSGG